MLTLLSHSGVHLEPLCLSNVASFEGVVDGEKVFSLEPRLPTLDGRDGELTIGARVADKFLECRFDDADIERHTLHARYGEDGDGGTRINTSLHHLFESRPPSTERLLDPRLRPGGVWTKLDLEYRARGWEEGVTPRYISM